MFDADIHVVYHIMRQLAAILINTYSYNKIDLPDVGAQCVTEAVIA